MADVTLRRDTPKSKAWADKRTPLPRGKGLERGAGPTINRDRYSTDFQVRGSTLAQRSPTTTAFYKEQRVPFVQALMADVTVCQAPAFYALAGIDDPLLGECAGPLDPHERLRRGQSGSLLTRLNVIAICRRHHDRCGTAGRGSAENLARLVVFEGDDGWRLLLAPRGERKGRA